MKERNEKTYSRLARKCNAVEDLLYSRKSKVAVEKEMLQINEQIKLLISLNHECNELLGKEDQSQGNKVLDMVDKQIFTFRRKNT